jgi:putative peptide zinc metalloprotease protein
VVVLLCFTPLPLWTRAEGVIWVPDDAQVRAGADGFVRTIAALPGSSVRRGSVLIIGDDPSLRPKMRVLEAQLRLLEIRAQAERVTDRARWLRTYEEIKATAAELEQARTLIKEQTVLSRTSGTFILPAAQDLPDRFVRKGQQIGYVVPASVVTARVLVSQDQVDLVRNRTERVEVKLAGRVYDTFAASIRRESPAATNKLSNLAMSSIGGGQAVVDPHESKEPKALNTWFEFELELPATQAFVLGEHVYVRFEHGSEAVAWRMYRSVRQLFMKRFAV